MTTIQFELNGETKDSTIHPGESLLNVLREQHGICSLKNGCEPQGQCGACVALVNGRPRVTCATPAAKAAGKSIQTLEGLQQSQRDLLAKCLVAKAGLQCGFCTPGIAMRAWSLIGKNPSPTRKEIAKALDVHLCRCTGYTKIFEAVELMAAIQRGEATLPEINVLGRVGDRFPRFQGEELSLGSRPYVADLQFEGMLHGSVVLSKYARARVIRIDTSKAEALEGVVAVATYRDVPGERWYGQIYADWPGFIAEGEEARCVGDFIAAIAAVDEYTARQAAKLVEVEYEELEPLVHPVDALKEGAHQVNPTHHNLLSRTTIQYGDVDAALAASAYTVTKSFETQRIEHLFLEPESAVVRPRKDGRLHLYSQGQGVFEDRRQVASFLGIEVEEFFVELVPNGGAFGGKEDLTIQAHTALLAQMTGKPVKLTLNREESVRVHPKRHPLYMDYVVGCDKDGHLTAVKAKIIGDTGAYASVGGKVLERAGGHATGPYIVPAVDINAVAVYTNNPPCGAMRGFGVNQTSFAIEGCLDILAKKVGIDGWEMRWRNAVDIGDMITTGQILEKSVGLKKTLLAVKDEYYASLKAGRAVGIACGLKNSGLGNGAIEHGKARLVVRKDGKIYIYNGFTEMGQGLFTVLSQCATEVTGLSADTFIPKVDATFNLQCGQTTGSRATLLGGRAVEQAAILLLKDLNEHGGDLSKLVGKVYEGNIVIDDTTPLNAKVDKIKTHTSFGFATQVAILDENGRVDRVLAAHDVGRAINPALCEGQIEGAVHMGLGYALTEELPCHKGMPVTYKMREIGVLRARDMPSVKVTLIEEHEPEGPFGAKGLGEIGLVPTAGAVAGALAMFDGIHRNTLPMKDSPAGKAISVGKIKKKRAEGERWT